MSDSREDVGAYLLGALSEAEAASFERDMERDDTLRAEVDFLRVAAEALPASTIQMAPPPALKGRIMAVVESEAQLLRAAGPEADRPPEPSRPRRRVVAVLRPGWWSLRPGIAVAASVLVLAVGAAVGGLLAGGSGERFSTDPTSQAKLIQRDGGHSTLVVTDLNSAEPGYVYQVWLQRKGQDPKPTNALFSPRGDGTASVDVPGKLKGVVKVLVTEEPEGGSHAPTTPPVIEVRPA